MNHPAHDHSNSEHSHRSGDSKPAYWQRAHHDWKFWVALCLMLLGMMVYILTMDLSIQPVQTDPPETKQNVP